MIISNDTYCYFHQFDYFSEIIELPYLCLGDLVRSININKLITIADLVYIAEIDNIEKITKYLDDKLLLKEEYWGFAVIGDNSAKECVFYTLKYLTYISKTYTIYENLASGDIGYITTRYNYLIK